MSKIDIVLQKLPLKDFLKANRISLRFDINNKKLAEDVEHIENNIEGIRNAWKREPDVNLGDLLITKGYLKDDPILSDINEWKWMFVNGHISDLEYKTYK